MSSENPQPAEIKGGKREADVYDLLAWLEVNKTRVLTAAVVLVLVGFAIATVRHLREQKEVQASGELLALKPALNPPTNTPPVQASALNKVAQEYSGTAAAERARILAATALYTEGKYAEAEAAFKAFLTEFSDSPWRGTAAYGVASSQEAQNKPEALASYQGVVSTYAKHGVADEARLDLARIHELKNQPAEALRIYNEMLATPPGTQPGAQPSAQNPTAIQRKEALLRKHPELNTNAPAAAASMPLTAPSLQLGGTNKTLQITPSPATNAPK